MIACVVHVIKFIWCFLNSSKRKLFSLMLQQDCKICSKLYNERPDGEKLSESFHLLDNKSQVRGMHTVIR